MIAVLFNGPKNGETCKYDGIREIIHVAKPRYTILELIRFPDDAELDMMKTGTYRLYRYPDGNAAQDLFGRYIYLWEGWKD